MLRFFGTPDKSTSTDKSETNNWLYKSHVFIYFCGRKGMVSISMYPYGEKFNKQMFSENVFEDLTQNLNTKDYYIHLDNA